MENGTASSVLAKARVLFPDLKIIGENAFIVPGVTDRLFYISNGRANEVLALQKIEYVRKFGFVKGYSNNKWGTYTLDGKELIDRIYQSIDSFTSKTAIARLDKSCYGLVDLKGNSLTAFKYSNIITYDNSISVLSSFGSYEIYNSKYGKLSDQIFHTGNIIVLEDRILVCTTYRCDVYSLLFGKIASNISYSETTDIDGVSLRNGVKWTVPLTKASIIK